MTPAEFTEYTQVAETTWTVRDELAAQTVELLQLVHRAVAQLGGAKRLPDIRRVPRPKPAVPARRRGWVETIRALGGGGHD